MMLALSSCRRNKELAAITGPANPKVITEEMEANLVSYDWFGAKVATEVDINGKKMSFKTNLRIRKDSIIWMSISPALGIEVARMMVTPDSIFFLDKWNDQYFTGSHDFIEDKIDIELDFSMLQDLAVGNPILYDEEDKFKGTKDDDAYVITSRTKGRIRRAAGIRNTRKSLDDKPDSLAIDIDERTLERVIERSDDDEDLVVKRYWVEPEHYKVIRLLVNDLLNLRSFQADYGEFEVMAGQRIPMQSSYTIIDQEQHMQFEMKYSRVKINQATSFPFTIPEKFERVE